MRLTLKRRQSPPPAPAAQAAPNEVGGNGDDIFDLLDSGLDAPVEPAKPVTDYRPQRAEDLIALNRVTEEISNSQIQQYLQQHPNKISLKHIAQADGLISAMRGHPELSKNIDSIIQGILRTDNPDEHIIPLLLGGFHQYVKPEDIKKSMGNVGKMLEKEELRFQREAHQKAMERVMKRKERELGTMKVTPLRTYVVTLATVAAIATGIVYGFTHTSNKRDEIRLNRRMEQLQTEMDTKLYRHVEAINRANQNGGLEAVLDPYQGKLEQAKKDKLIDLSKIRLQQYASLQTNAGAEAAFKKAKSMPDIPADEFGAPEKSPEALAQQIKSKVAAFKEIATSHQNTYQGFNSQANVVMLTYLNNDIFPASRIMTEIDAFVANYANTDLLTTKLIVSDLINRVFILNSKKAQADATVKPDMKETTATSMTVDWIRQTAKKNQGTGLGFELEYILGQIASGKDSVYTVYDGDQDTFVRLDSRLIHGAKGMAHADNAAERYLKSAGFDHRRVSRAETEIGTSTLTTKNYALAMLYLDEAISLEQNDANVTIRSQWMPQAYLGLRNVYFETGQFEKINTLLDEYEAKYKVALPGNQQPDNLRVDIQKINADKQAAERAENQRIVRKIIETVQ